MQTMNTIRLLAITIVSLLLTVAGLWSVSAPGFAQSASEAESVEDSDSEATDAEPSAEVFIPTEEISEDFAVSFPVDI